MNIFKRTFRFIEAGLEAWSGDPAVALQGTDEADAAKYRRLSGSKRDLAPLKQDKIREMVLYLVRGNPLAKRLIQIPIDFCLGDEFKVSVRVMKRNVDGEATEVDTKKVQWVWDNYANADVNAFPYRVRLMIMELLMSGELCMPAIVNPMNGEVALGYIDSSFIEEVVPDPSGWQVGQVILKKDLNGTQKKMEAIHYGSDPNNLDSYGRLTGECFLFQWNKLLGQLRGYSDLTELVDWIDALDQFMFNNLAHSGFLNAFFLDVTVTGGKAEELRTKFAEELIPPENGSVSVHNEKILKEYKTPKLNSSETDVAVKMWKNFILAGKGYPEHWFADGSTTNVATASQMGQPTMRMLKTIQVNIRNVITPIVLFILQNQPKERIKLEPDEYFDVTVNMYDFSRDDAAVIANGFTQTVQALILAEEKNWVTAEQAKKVVDSFLMKIGVVPEVNKTIAEITDENDANREITDVTKTYGDPNSPESKPNLGQIQRAGKKVQPQMAGDNGQMK
jgi:hypothetical protein